MRIALCLYGHLGIASLASSRTTNDIIKESEAASTDPSHAHAHFSRMLFPHYDVDVFIHSWSVQHQDRVQRLYSPKGSIFEAQIKFESSLSQYGMIGENISQWDISGSARVGYELLLPSRKNTKRIMNEMERESFRTKSRWYSSKQAIVLKSAYEASNNFEYDFVLVARPDCLFKTRFNFENMDPGCFYATQRSGRADIDHALFDFWFASGKDNMDKFATLYDHIHDYCIRPTFASREHVKKVIGEEKLRYMLVNDRDYRKA